MRARPLAKLVDPAGVAALLEAALALAPGSAIRLIGEDGRTVAEIGRPHAASPTAALGDDSIREPIEVDGVVCGTVEVVAAGAAGPAVARFVGRAIEMATAEVLRRRVIGAAAIHDLRELALLSRLSEMLGESVDPGAIADCTLATVSRPLGAVVGLVLGPDDRIPLAGFGDPGDVGLLSAAAGPLIDRLRAQASNSGTCAEVDNGQSGPFPAILVAFLSTARGHQGSIALARRPDAGPFTAVDRQLLAAVAGQAAVAIERAALQRQVAERRVLDRELEIGRRIQLSLMPRRFPSVPGWEIASAYEPAREVGGDFFDVFPLRDRPSLIGLVVADVTGKGIPAAILMADSRALIHAAADHSDDPADTLGRVNRILVGERASGLFVTVVHGVLDAPSGRLRLASAGHDPIHVLRSDGRLEILDPPGRLIGMVDDIVATTIELELEPGDAWIAHTDGVTEARDPSGAFYGEERLRALLGGLAGASAGEIVAAVTTDVASFRDVAEPSDDLTMLVMRRLASADEGDPG
jgi:serine phosphatase RsbU (regulator of sigma subunit)